jgi:uncharacterized protein YbcI
MADTDTETPQRAELPARISSSLALVWRRYAGQRPTSVETAIVGTRISCVLADSVQGFDQGMAASELDDAGRTGPAPTLASYRREAIEAVAKATRQRVMAFVSDHDAKSDVATEVFILDGPPRRHSIFVDRRLS